MVYREEILEDMFNNFCNSLRVAGAKSYEHAGFSTTFTSFKKHGFLRNDTNYGNENGFTVDNNLQTNDNEITINTHISKLI